MKYLGINTGESHWSRSWKALQLHLSNTGKMNDRANIAENVVLATDLLLINTKLPSNPPYISLSTHTLQRWLAQTSGKEKDHQDLVSVPQAAPQLSIFPSSLHGAHVRSFLQRCPLNVWICSWSKAFSSMAVLESSKGCWNGSHQIKSNQIKVKYIQRCILDRGWGSSKPTWLFGSSSCLCSIGFIRQWPTWPTSWIPSNFLLHLGFINCITPQQSRVLVGFVLPSP